MTNAGANASTSANASQSHVHSWLETLSNTTIGFAVSFTMQAVLYPLYGIHVSVWGNLGLTGIFTAVSIVRGFFVRRLWNWVHVRGAKK